MSLPIVADADTLFPATTRGLLIYLDFGGLIRLHWSPMILDEVARALVDAGRKKTLDDAKAHEARMQDALPHALVATRNVQAQFASVAHAVRSAKDVHENARFFTNISPRPTSPSCKCADIIRRADSWRFARFVVTSPSIRPISAGGGGGGCAGARGRGR